MLKIYTDGGSRGNPGEAAYGVHILNDDKTITGFGKRLGIATNNVAEYSGLIAALSWIEANRQLIGQTSGIESYLDSQLICRQMQGLYKVKDENLKGYYFQAKEKERALGIPVTYIHIPREQNSVADKYVNEALDNNPS